MESRKIKKPSEIDSPYIWLLFMLMFEPFFDDSFKKDLFFDELKAFCEKYNMDAEEIGKHTDELKSIMEKDYDRLNNKFKELNEELLNKNTEI